MDSKEQLYVIATNDDIPNVVINEETLHRVADLTLNDLVWVNSVLGHVICLKWSEIRFIISVEEFKAFVKSKEESYVSAQGK